MENLYGNSFDQTVKPGINKCTVSFFGLNPNGGAGGSAKDVIDLVVNVGELEIRDRTWEIEPSKVNPKTFKNKFTGKEETETEDKAVKRAFKEYNTRIKDLVLAFGVKEEAFMEAMKTVTSHATMAKAIESILPENYTELEMECILGYDNKGYLKMPTKYWVTNSVLRLKNSTLPALQVSKRVKMQKPLAEGEEEPTTTNTTAKINW